MSMKRITITIPPDVLAAAEAAAAAEGVSVSAWLSRAAAHSALIAQGLAAAAEVFEKIGWPTAEDDAEVDRVLDRATARGSAAATHEVA